LIDYSKYSDHRKMLDPPGFYRDFIKGIDNRHSISVFAYDNHRFLFYALALYYLELREKKIEVKPLTLISFDYHWDLCSPSEDSLNDLQKVDLSNRNDIAFCCWNCIHPQNDTQIKSALFLNLIDDVHYICKDRQHDEGFYKDKNGNNHRVSVYEDTNEFLKIVNIISNDIVLDIDLDYFSYKKIDSSGHKRIHIDNCKDKMVFFDVNYTENIIKYLAPKIQLITIAKEPEHCGSMYNSNILFNDFINTIIDGDVFDASLSRSRLRLLKRKPDIS